MHHGFESSATEILERGRSAPLKVVETWFLVQRVSDLISFLRSRTADGNEPFYLFFGDVLSRETDAVEVEFNMTSAAFEVDVQAQRMESRRLIRQIRIDGNQLASKSEKLMSQNLS